MKYLISLAFAFAFIQLAFGLCKEGSECKEDECCTVIGLVGMTGTCVKRPEEGDICSSLTSTVKNKEGLYKFGCPCAEGLKCVDEGKIMKKHKCRAE